MPEDPRCPECGGPIGQTATYCMHCSADLTEERGGLLLALLVFVAVTAGIAAAVGWLALRFVPEDVAGP